MVVVGLGAIGQEIARAAWGSPEVELVGAVDTQPQLVGRPLSEVVGVAGLRGKVTATLEAALGRRKGVVVLHATGSRLEQVMGELLEAVRLRLPVVSTCEELAFPWLRYPELADELERAAQRAGVAVLGAGVNPGFVLDRLVATAGQVCGSVRHVTARRVVDVSTRRESLQRRVGVGLTEEEFFDQVDKELLGHVGLVESAALCALGLGLDCDDFEEEIAPVFAEEDLTRGAFPVKRGRVAGLFQSAVGLQEGQERVRLELTLAVGAPAPGDRIELEADPPLVLEVVGGVPGERATANVLVNAAPRITAAEAGLLTVLELPAGR